MLTHQFQVALESASREDHVGRAEVIRQTSADIDAAHTASLTVLDEERRDFGVPDEVNVRPTETFPVDGADESDASSICLVLTLDAVASKARESRDQPTPSAFNQS